MFQLYKDRDFGAYISDTIDFFKKFGKHYFKNYLIVNGFFLIILVVLMYFFSTIYLEIVTGSQNAAMYRGFTISNFIEENAIVFIVGLIFFILLMMVISVINYALPSLYIELYENNGLNFSSKELFQSLKQNFGRLLIFFLASLFVMTPIVLLLFTLNILLCFIIIGFPLFFITFPAVMVWIYLSFNDYILGKNSYFTALGNGYSMLKANFWPSVGSTLVMFFILYILQSLVTMVPYMIGIGSIFASGENFQDPNNPNAEISFFSILMIVIFMISTLVGFLFQNILNVQQVLIYYSQLEGSAQNSAASAIELIGQDSE